MGMYWRNRKGKRLGSWISILVINIKQIIHNVRSGILIFKVLPLLRIFRLFEQHMLKGLIQYPLNTDALHSHYMITPAFVKKSNQASFDSNFVSI